VHTPNHASWLNQVEIYFSIVQRKVMTPNDFASLSELEDRLLAFQGEVRAGGGTFSMDLHPNRPRRAVGQAESQGIGAGRVTEYVTFIVKQST
jgi:hypothetical protein